MAFPLLNKVAITAGGYLLAALLGWLLLGAREDIGKIREQCNTRIASAVAASERNAREALSEAHGRELAQRDALLQAERSALRAARTEAERAALDASEANAMIVRLREAAEDAGNVEDCLLQPVPGAIVDSVR